MSKAYYDGVFSDLLGHLLQIEDISQYSGMVCKSVKLAKVLIARLGYDNPSQPEQNESIIEYRNKIIE